MTNADSNPYEATEATDEAASSRGKWPIVITLVSVLLGLRGVKLAMFEWRWSSLSNPLLRNAPDDSQHLFRFAVLLGALVALAAATGFIFAVGDTKKGKTVSFSLMLIGSLTILALK